MDYSGIFPILALVMRAFLRKNGYPIALLIEITHNSHVSTNPPYRIAFIVVNMY